MNLPFLILHILSIPVKPFGCGYAALSWILVIPHWILDIRALPENIFYLSTQ